MREEKDNAEAQRTRRFAQKAESFEIEEGFLASKTPLGMTGPGSIS
jgi:hypothetical protein